MAWGLRGESGEGIESLTVCSSRCCTSSSLRSNAQMEHVPSAARSTSASACNGFYSQC